MMLLIRNRLRALTTKPPLMPDHHPDQTSSSSSSSSSSHHSTNNNQTYLTSTLPSLFASSPLFIHFTNNNNNPLSVLHTNTFISPFGYPFSSYPYPYPYNTKSSSSIHRIELKNVGLAVISALKDEPFDDDNSRQPNNNVLFGTQLRLKIKEDSVCTRQVVSMELCEDYTCVISHNGPNTRTTHIFNNCIVDETYSYFPISETTFLTFCYTCNKHLDHTKDIFIYRGDKAFCSRECRYTEIMLDHNSESLTHILLT